MTSKSPRYDVLEVVPAAKIKVTPTIIRLCPRRCCTHEAGTFDKYPASTVAVNGETGVDSLSVFNSVVIDGLFFFLFLGCWDKNIDFPYILHQEKPTG